MLGCHGRDPVYIPQCSMKPSKAIAPCNLSTREVETGGSQPQSHLGYIRSSKPVTQSHYNLVLLLLLFRRWDLAIWPRLAWNSWQSSYLGFISSGLTGISHDTLYCFNGFCPLGLLYWDSGYVKDRKVLFCFFMDSPMSKCLRGVLGLPNNSHSSVGQVFAVC